MQTNQFLKDRRLELGLTQAEIARFVGVSEATVSRWESGDIASMRQNRISALAEILRVDINWIVSRGAQPVSELLRHGFEDLGLHTIWCDHYDGNNKSRRVIRKCGFAFRFVRIQRLEAFDYEPRLVMCYAMTRRDWEKRKSEGRP